MDENVLRDVRDGSLYKQNKFFRDNPEAYCMIIYSDALEVVNPIASAKGKHKVIQIFWTLREIPKYQRSKIDRYRNFVYLQNEKLVKET